MISPRQADVVVVGGGVAGLTAGLALAPLEVVLLTKGPFGRSSATALAQGGIAAAVGSDDGPELHAADTLLAGAGHCRQEAVDCLAQGAPEAIRDLVALGVRFDRISGGAPALGREAAHSRSRVLHADGDATGAELVRALGEAIRLHSNVTLLDEVFVEDLIMERGRVVGVLARHCCGDLHRSSIRSPAVVLATGGLGQVYSATTNPKAATGDGLAMAARAGALLADLEFVQFHPTALDVGLDPMPLVTEALRGAGAVLLDEQGRRFMAHEHALAELAPRDVVARAIWRRLASGGSVFLDAREAVGRRFPDRFPTVYRHAKDAGIDARRELLPVSPAAHYSMGGVVTDLDGRSSLPGLWACGEVACTGAHGANRLASNSLLEGLVFGAAVARDIVRQAGPASTAGPVPSDFKEAELETGQQEIRGRAREVMWRRVGLERDGMGLWKALQELLELEGSSKEEDRNPLLVSRLIAAAALVREESRGAHSRSDWPESVAGFPGRTSYTAHEILHQAESHGQPEAWRREATG